MSKNKLYNRSYFTKRLVESGFSVQKLNIIYQLDDIRKWSVIVNPSKQLKCYNFNVLVTCYKDDKTKEFYFKFQGQNKEDFCLKTKSMKLIIRIFQKTVQLFDPNKSILEQENAFNHNTVNQLEEENKEDE